SSAGRREGLFCAMEVRRMAMGLVGRSDADRGSFLLLRDQGIRASSEIESPRRRKWRALSRVMRLPAFTDLPGDFPLALGGALRGVRIRWEEWGRRTGDGANTIVVFPALSAHSHLRSHGDDPSEGWWEAMVGPGRAFDTNRWHVLCASLIGSP